MDAYYLRDYWHGYLKGLKKYLKTKNIILMLIGGVVMSVVSGILFKRVAASSLFGGSLTVAVCTLTLFSTVAMLLSGIREYFGALLNRIIFLFRNKIYISGYTIIGVIVALGLLLCLAGNSWLALALALLLILTPGVVSLFFSAFLNSLFKMLKNLYRIGSDLLEGLLCGGGMIVAVMSLLFIIIGGAL